MIPLRPLSLSDIFNGAVAYIRANPKATLGLTTVVVVVAQLLALILSVGPLAFTGELQPSLSGEEVSPGVVLGSSASSLAGAGATWLSSILLSGMLTVVVGRAVFGTSITISEAWQRLRPRLWALIGFTVLEVVGAVVLVAVVVLIISGVAVAAGGVAAAVARGAVGAGPDRRAWSIWARCSASRRRSSCWNDCRSSPRSRARFKLVRNDFWRVLGIRLLGGIVAAVIAGAVTVPFSFGGQILLVSGVVHTDGTHRARPAVHWQRDRSDHHRTVFSAASSCCSTPTAASAPRRSTWCCRPERRSGPALRPIPPTTSG